MSRITNLSTVLPEVAADFERVIGASARPRLALLDQDHDPEVLEQIPDAAEWIDGDTGSQVLLLIGGNVTSMTAQWSDTGELAVECASALQTYVMDERNAPWPVLPGGAGVAEPNLREGTAQWTWNGGAVPFGQLSSVLR
ncbi:hypothetical protein [Curtobacterium sp. PsM8]|uniref:hypothetical protein n=1 Tax=Curtobacterium sp. PsM8 TaxID=3030532 RepID=UPI00263B3E31|nr:hypothetical protein [Curtobacterium sp. PsM8]MDN4648149.1 hypothetical protein [Curtobacterium sp. PsM8]